MTARKVKQLKDKCLEKNMPKTYSTGEIYNFKNLMLHILYGGI